MLKDSRRRLRLRHHSLRTEQADLASARRSIHANGRRHPRGMGVVEVEEFLVALANEGQVAAGMQIRKQMSGSRGQRAVLDPLSLALDVTP